MDDLIKLDNNINANRQEIKSDRMDMSFGEIINMYEENEIIISPEYQRAFRWDDYSQTKFIETILLGIPFPPIFVAEDKNNIWELVDGLQRLSTILSFFGKLKDKDKNNLTLTEGGIIPELNGLTIETIPLKYKLLLKRAVCRVEIIRLDSKFNMKYELFNRLNTAGISLTPQEIRNCIYRADDDKFSKFLQEISKLNDFRMSIKISKSDEQKMLFEELALRYLSLKNRKERFGQNIQQHFDNYMKKIVNGEEIFDYQKESDIFKRIFKKIHSLKKNIFKMSTLNFSTSLYDSILLNAAEKIEKFENFDSKKLIDLIEQIKNNADFKKNAGSASSNQTKINAKVEIAKKYFGF